MSAREVAVRDDRPAPVAAPTRYDELWRLARRIADTEFVPGDLRRRPDAVMACILYGQGLGVTEMQSLKHIAVVKGRPTESAALQRALVLRAGHTLICEERSAERATITGIRADNRVPMTVTWTIEDAVRAELVGLDPNTGLPLARSREGKVLPWESYTRTMLYNRASTELVRAHFGEVLLGFAPVLRDLDFDAELAAEEYQSAITISTAPAAVTGSGFDDAEPDEFEDSDGLDDFDAGSDEPDEAVTDTLEADR